MSYRLVSIALFAICIAFLVAPALGQPAFDVYGGIPVGAYQTAGLYDYSATGLYDPRTTVPVGEQLPSVEFKLAGGEYESGTLAIQASGGDVSDTMVTLSDLTFGANVISSSAIDVRTIKWWYQSNKWNPTQFVYVPELLLHDDTVVLSSNHTTKTNTLKYDMSTIHDADTLQPVSLPNNTLKQYWITVDAAPDQAAGIYSGTATVTTSNAGSKVPVSNHRCDLGRVVWN
jgi:hypothetical protein